MVPRLRAANEIPPLFPSTLLLPVVWAEAEQPHNCYLLKSIAEKCGSVEKKVKNQSGLNDFSVTATTAVSQQLESLSSHPCCKAEEVFDHRHKVKASKPLSADKRDFSKTAPPERAVTNSPCFVSAYEENQVVNKDGRAVLKFYERIQKCH